MKVHFTSSILRKIIISIFVIGGLFGCLFFGLFFQSAYTQQIDEISDQINILSERQLGLLANFVWNFDANGLQTQLNGMLNHPEIQLIELNLNGEMHRAGNPETLSVNRMENSHRLEKTVDGALYYLGDLKVYSSLDNVRKHIINSYFTTFLAFIVALLVACLLMYFLLYLYFFRHFERIVSFTNPLDSTNLDQRL